MAQIYGDRDVTLIRELTKIYEEYRRGKISEVLLSLKEQPIKGECLIIVAGFNGEVEDNAEDETTALEAVQLLVASGIKPNVAIKQVAKERELVRQDLYAQYHDL